MSMGLVVAALFMVPLALLSLNNLNRLRHTVDTLVQSHFRQEDAGRQLVFFLAQAKRAERNLILYRDSTYIEAMADCSMNVGHTIDSLSVLMGPDDSIAVHARELYGGYTRSLDSLIASLPASVPKIDRLRRHAGKKLSQYRNELDDLLKTTSRADESTIRDSLLSEVELRLLSIDLDSLLIDLPSEDSQIAHIELELDEFHRNLSKTGEDIISWAREEIDNDFRVVSILVSRGQRNLLAVLFASITALVAWILYFPRKLYIPLTRFNKVMQRMSKGDIDQIIPTYPYSELNTMSATLNDVREYFRKTDELKSNRVRIHWRRLQLLAGKSSDYWCLADQSGKSILMSAPLAAMAKQNMDCGRPPNDLTVEEKHLIDPIQPERGYIIWFKPATKENASS